MLKRLLIRISVILSLLLGARSCEGNYEGRMIGTRSFTSLLIAVLFGAILFACTAQQSSQKAIYWTQMVAQKSPLQDSIMFTHDTIYGETFGFRLPKQIRTGVCEEQMSSDGYTYRLLKTKLAGENDIPIKATILSISKGNKILNAVILSLDFTFETEHFAHFVVTTDSIHIHRYEVEHLEFDKETGDIIGNRNTPDTTIYSSLYLIRDGHIIKQ